MLVESSIVKLGRGESYGGSGGDVHFTRSPKSGSLPSPIHLRYSTPDAAIAIHKRIGTRRFLADSAPKHSHPITTADIGMLLANSPQAPVKEKSVVGYTSKGTLETITIRTVGARTSPRAEDAGKSLADTAADRVYDDAQISGIHNESRRPGSRKSSKRRVPLKIKLGAGGLALLALAACAAPRTRAGFVQDAKSKIGADYAWGCPGSSDCKPNTYDCSGLVYSSLTDIGVKNVPRTSEEQYAWAIPVLEHHLRQQKYLLNHLEPGYLLFEEFPGADNQQSPNHVVIYAGDSRIIEAAHTGVPVHEVRWSLRKLHRQGGYLVGVGKVPGLPAKLKTQNS